MSNSPDDNQPIKQRKSSALREAPGGNTKEQTDAVRKFAVGARELVDGFVEWADARWYMTGLLFPALVLGIMLGLVAGLGSPWLWPVVFLIAVPALMVVFFTKREDFGAGESGWHLR